MFPFPGSGKPVPSFADWPVSGLTDSRIDYGVLHYESASHDLTGKSQFLDTCNVPVLPGNTEHLKLALVNTPGHCSLVLSGTCELYGELHVNRLLKASAPGSGQPANNNINDPWFLPESLELVKAQSHTGVMCPAFDGEVYYPGQKADFFPEAMIIVREGRMVFSSGGGLHRVGIVDARSSPGNERPLLFSGSGEGSGLHFRQAAFKRHFPCVSDINDSHPYWNNNELSDTAGRAATRVGRMALWFFRSSSSCSASLGSGRSISSDSSGGDRPPERPKKFDLPKAHYNDFQERKVDKLTEEEIEERINRAFEEKNREACDRILKVFLILFPAYLLYRAGRYY